jgi:hypothetical protein
MSFFLKQSLLIEAFSYIEAFSSALKSFFLLSGLARLPDAGSDPSRSLNFCGRNFANFVETELPEWNAIFFRLFIL